MMSCPQTPETIPETPEQTPDSSYTKKRRIDDASGNVYDNNDDTSPAGETCRPESREEAGEIDPAQTSDYFATDDQTAEYLTRQVHLRLRFEEDPGERSELKFKMNQI
jgi:hypothetical protein